MNMRKYGIHTLKIFVNTYAKLYLNVFIGLMLCRLARSECWIPTKVQVNWRYKHLSHLYYFF